MNLLTFDIEEWYVYQLYPKGGKEYYLPIINDYLNKLLELLDCKNQKATFFCLGKVADEYPEVIESIAQKGHEIGCHSDKHIFVNKMTPKEFYNDTQRAIKSIESITGKKVLGYRAPAFSIGEQNNWAFQVLCDLGIEYDSSVFPAFRRFGGYPSFIFNEPVSIKIGANIIKEFPISTRTIFNKKITISGGGYFRLFPYDLITKFTKESSYNMSYFHIRDFDSKQKRVKSLSYFYSYYGINGAFEKLNRYISNHDFISIEQANKEIDWVTAPIFII